MGDEGDRSRLVRRADVDIDVSEVAPRGCRKLHGVLFSCGQTEASGPLWCCFPGGGVTSAYFDLDVPPELGEFSMARYLAERGAVVLLVDPPGVGRSDVPEDPYLLTPKHTGQIIDRAVASALRSFEQAEVDGFGPWASTAVVGVGHSAGGLLAVSSQAEGRTFDALALLGFSDTGLEEFLTDEERDMIGRPDLLDRALPGLAEKRFGSALPPRPEFGSMWEEGVLGDALRDADERASAPLLALVGLAAIIPGSMKPQMDLVDVPTFSAMGDRDIAGSRAELAAQLPACPDLTLITLPETGHNHNMAAARFQLWERMLSWYASLG